MKMKIKMQNVIERSPEFNKFLKGSVIMYMLSNVFFICLKFKYPHNFNYHIWSAFLFSHLLSLGIGKWIYSKRTVNIPHFWVGVITYSLIAGAISGMFYLLD